MLFYSFINVKWKRGVILVLKTAKYYNFRKSSNTTLITSAFPARQAGAPVVLA